MKKGMIIVLSIMLMVSTTGLGFAAPNAKALEQADENAVFNRVGDWFATVGKSDVEKTKILAERKAQRAVKRAEKLVEKNKKMAEKRAGDAKKKMKQKGSMKKGS